MTEVKRLLLFIVLMLLITPAGLKAQIGGSDTYSFLNLTSSPRIAAMGGDFLAVYDHDITLASTNPSLINPEMHNMLGVSYVDYFSDINYGHATYSRSFKNIGSFAGSMQYINYGQFDFAEANGDRAGTFGASETALILGWGRQLDTLFSIGSNLKFIYSSFESYSSFGLGVDVVGSYTSRDRSFMVSLIAKNIGRQLSAYEGGNNEPLPFELQIGLSKRLKHLPFRYSILFDHLEKWDLSYDDPATVEVDPITGEPIEQSGFEEFADNFMRHIVLGAELMIGKNLSVRAGYNYRRRQELKLENKPATVGFSWGFGVRISKFHFSYARSAYHLAGSPNYITVTTNFSDFFEKKN
jgi:hypothetical protein